MKQIDLEWLDELYDELNELDPHEDKDRQAYVTVISKIMMIEIQDIMTVYDGKLKVELFAEALSEALLQTLKTFLLLHPSIHPNNLVKDLADEFKLKLSDWYPGKDEIRTDKYIN
jgi:hypothetical protein